VNSDEWTVLSVSCDLQAAKARSDQLQEQLTRRDTDLHDAKEQLLKLQKEFAGKCDEVTADKHERAALQKAHRASLKASIHCAQTLALTSHAPPHPPSPHPTLAAMMLNSSE